MLKFTDKSNQSPMQISDAASHFTSHMFPGQGGQSSPTFNFSAHNKQPDNINIDHISLGGKTNSFLNLQPLQPPGQRETNKRVLHKSVSDANVIYNFKKSSHRGFNAQSRVTVDTFGPDAPISPEQKPMGTGNYVSIMKRKDLEHNLASQHTMNFVPPAHGGKIGQIIDIQQRELTPNSPMMLKYDKLKTMRRGSTIMGGLRRQSTVALQKQHFLSQHGEGGGSSSGRGLEEYKNLLIQKSIESDR